MLNVSQYYHYSKNSEKQLGTDGGIFILFMYTICFNAAVIILKGIKLPLHFNFPLYLPLPPVNC